MRDLELGELVTLDRSVMASHVEAPIFLVVEKKETTFHTSKLKYPFYYIFSPATGKIGPFQRGDLDELTPREGQESPTHQLP